MTFGLNSVCPIAGGDLHYHLSQHGVFSEREARFYATEIILGLEHMHGRSVVYRDLKVRLGGGCGLLSPGSAPTHGGTALQAAPVPPRQPAVFLSPCRLRHLCDAGLFPTLNSVLVVPVTSAPATLPGAAHTLVQKSEPVNSGKAG